LREWALTTGTYAPSSVAAQPLPGGVRAPSALPFHDDHLEVSCMPNTHRRLIVGALALVAAIVPASAVASSNGGAARGCAHGPGTSLAVIHSYRIQLHIGMPEKMYTPAEVRKLRPKSGEVMLGGVMGMAGMAMNGTGAIRHLEVQICARKTGAVIAEAIPSITVNDPMGMATHVPVAKMRGVLSDAADIHFGNNVKLPLGQVMRIRVALRGETIVFRQEPLPRV
jgi:hypothetical protein